MVGNRLKALIDNEGKLIGYVPKDGKFIETKEFDGTLFGIEVSKYQEILDWFKVQGFNPYNWKEFSKELGRRKME